MNDMKSARRKIDWIITLTVYLSIFPEQGNRVIAKVRFFFGDTVGVYFLILGVGTLLTGLFLSFSKFGNIVLGAPDEKPRYSFFTWGSMMFTCGLVADILFYSFAEWVMYAANPYV